MVIADLPSLGNTAKPKWERLRAIWCNPCQVLASPKIRFAKTQVFWQKSIESLLSPTHSPVHGPNRTASFSPFFFAIHIIILLHDDWSVLGKKAFHFYCTARGPGARTRAAGSPQ